MIQRIILACFLTCIAASAFGQGYQGRDFWICFPANAIYEQGTAIELTLHITSDSRTTGTIQLMNDTGKIPFSVEYGAEIPVEIDSSIVITSSGQVERKSIHVTCDHDITLTAVSHRKASTDSYVAIPTSMLGKEYIVAGYASLMSQGYPTFTSQAEIIATEDNTLVTAHLTATTRDGEPAGRTIMFVLNRGEVFQSQGAGDSAHSDLTGTIVTASKPIAFFTGHRCAQVPNDVQFCDMLLEEEPPANDWGKEFIVTKFEGKTYSVVRVIAREDSTEVVLNGARVASLQKGGYCEIDTLHSDAEIQASKPVLVAQYSTSANADSIKIGDPFMLIVVPNDRFIKEVATTSVGTGQWYHYLNIVAPDSAFSSIRVDGRKIGPNVKHTRIADKLSVVPLLVEAGRHVVNCVSPIAVYSYGFGALGENYDSYGHACGMRLDINK
ncbi:MAG: IgGFc-binding protein [Bacteroidota bacterium]|nr:IgGFc-binding protein [Bacteroidota bacterium]MDP4233404.1 IgGFc-binding protein [Bacteroidota bacterium]MDP4242270.1 IgGFc-binding protein [Bacteroidota bacterium]MDP4287026.1 IgGFc-binding protein [Bacteroidota bacterium]